MGTVIAVTSGKGGTGKTSLTAGVSSCLAALGHRTLCVDLDIGLRNLDIALGMTDRAVMDFTDVMERRCSILTGAAEQPDIRGLFLLTAPVRADGLDTARFRQVVREACDLFDFVFLDCPAGLGEGFQLATAAADRAVVGAAECRAAETGMPAGAICLPDGRIVDGKTTDLMGASSSTLLNALKELAGIDHSIHLISPEALAPIQSVKVDHLGSVNPRLHSNEILIALASSAKSNPLAARALEQLSNLKNCQAHATVILSSTDANIYKKLGLQLTCEAQYESNKLYHKT